MSAPDREPETWANRVVLIAVPATAVCVVVGALLSPWVGAAMFVVFAVAIAVWLVIARSPDRSLLDAEIQGHRTMGDATRRVLLLANEALKDEVAAAALADEDRATVIDVLVPVNQSRMHLVTTDVDTEITAAQRRLDATLHAVRTQGFDASGRIGDPIDPLAGLQDELRLHDVNEVVVVTSNDSGDGWLPPKELDRLREQLTIPVRHIEAADHARRA